MDKNKKMYGRTVLNGANSVSDNPSCSAMEFCTFTLNPKALQKKLIIPSISNHSFIEALIIIKMSSTNKM
jgi:hypothetical protein